MFEFLIDKLQDTRFVVTVLTALAAMATVFTIAMPYAFNDSLTKRMRMVALERTKIRSREREKLARDERVDLRRAPKAYMRLIVEKLNLRKHLGEETARATLINAGYCGQAPQFAYLFFRMVMPITLFVFSLVYMFVIIHFDQPLMIKVAAAIGRSEEHTS